MEWVSTTGACGGGKLEEERGCLLRGWGNRKDGRDGNVNSAFYDDDVDMGFLILFLEFVCDMLLCITLKGLYLSYILQFLVRSVFVPLNYFELWICINYGKP